MADRAPRARDLGLPFDGSPGPLNAITDIAGIHVGTISLVEDAPRPGRHRPVRTGVTAILPHAGSDVPVPLFAGTHRFNGNGEMTGTHWIDDGGWFCGPVLITNTHAVGRAHHAAIAWMIDRYGSHFAPGRHVWAMPVVAETYDGVLSDINAQALTEADMRAALDGARPGPVAEGNSGGGTGMIAYGFKGGTGTASRRIAIDGRDYLMGALVQANHGVRDWLTVCGVPVGRHLRAAASSGLAEDGGPGRERGAGRERGSIIVILATDAPLAPHQLRRVARRGAIGIGRGGTIGGNGSGDIFLAFSTANPGPMPGDAPSHRTLVMLNDECLDTIYGAAVQAVEEAVLNAMVAARDMGGTAWDEALVPAIDHDLLRRLAAGS